MLVRGRCCCLILTGHKQISLSRTPYGARQSPQRHSDWNQSWGWPGVGGLWQQPGIFLPAMLSYPFERTGCAPSRFPFCAASLPSKSRVMLTSDIGGDTPPEDKKYLQKSRPQQPSSALGCSTSVPARGDRRTAQGPMWKRLAPLRTSYFEPHPRPVFQGLV